MNFKLGKCTNVNMTLSETEGRGGLRLEKPCRFLPAKMTKFLKRCQMFLIAKELFALCETMAVTSPDYYCLWEENFKGSASKADLLNTNPIRNHASCA